MLGGCRFVVRTSSAASACSSIVASREMHSVPVTLQPCAEPSAVRFGAWLLSIRYRPSQSQSLSEPLLVIVTGLSRDLVHSSEVLLERWRARDHDFPTGTYCLSGLPLVLRAGTTTPEILSCPHLNCTTNEELEVRLTSVLKQPLATVT